MAEPVTTPEPKASPAEQRRQELVEEYILEPPEAAQPKEVPVAEAAPAPPPAPPVHSRRVLRMAHELGISQAEIDASTPDELDDAVYHTNRALHAERSRQVYESRQAPKPSAAATPEEDSLGTYTDQDGQAKSLDEYLAPEVAALLRGFKKQIKEIQQQVGFLGQREQHRETESYTDRIDRRLEQIDKDAFGAGSIRDLDPSSPHLAKRCAVVSEARRLAALQEERPTNDLVLRLVDAAAKNLFGVDVGHPTPKKVPDKDPVNGRFTKDQERWIDAAVARPTHRGNAEEPKGKSRATKKLTALMNEAGMEVGRDNVLEEELHDELPD